MKNKLCASTIFFSLFALGASAQNISGNKPSAAQNALAQATAAAGEPVRGVALRDKGLVFLHEDAGNIFYLIDNTVKPFQDSGFAFAFDVRRDYKVEDKNNPEDVGLKERFLVNCDKGVIGSSLVQHIRGDGMIGKLKPLELSKGMYQPAVSSYEFKALNYVCSSRLGDKYKTLVVSKQMPAPLPATPALPQQNKPEIEPDKKAISSNKPSHVDISKFAVIYQPDADPYYPSFSKRAGEQGEVVVRLIIDETGTVEEVALLRSSGFARLDRAATEIGRRYKFKPLLVNGKPTKVSTNLLIKFNLITEEEKEAKPKFEPNPLTTGG